MSNSLVIEVLVTAKVRNLSTYKHFSFVLIDKKITAIQLLRFSVILYTDPQILIKKLSLLTLFTMLSFYFVRSPIFLWFKE